MPSWLPGSSKQSVPQAPYFTSPPAQQPARPRISSPLASRSMSDLRHPAADQYRQQRPQTPYRAPNAPPVPAIPARYSAPQPREEEIPAMQGLRLTPPAEPQVGDVGWYEDPADEPPQEGPDVPDSPVQEEPTELPYSPHQRARPRMGRLANAPTEPLASPPVPPSARSSSVSSFSFPAPPSPKAKETVYTPPMPTGPQLNLFDLRYHSELVPGETSIWQVEMRYKVRVMEPVRR